MPASPLFRQLSLHAATQPKLPAILAPGCETITFAALDELSRDPSIRPGSVIPIALPDGPEFIIAALAALRRGVCAPRNPASPEPLTIGQVDAALLLQTSATTGRAKQVPISHANLQAMLENTIAALGLSPADRFLSMMPLFHLQGLAAVLAQLYAGGSVVATPGFDAARIAGWLEEYRPTWYTGGPPLHRALLAAIERSGRPIPSSLRFIRSIGAPLAADLLGEVEAKLVAPVLEGYGLTEAGLVTSNPLPPRERKPGSVGISVGPEIRIADGEILLRGTAVISGYYEDEDANVAVFRDGWFRTGDLGRFDADGYLYITGRLKEIINRGGEKIIPQEVDAALLAHPAVAEAAAFGVPHPTLTEDIAAAVVLRPGMSVTETDLRQFAAERLLPFKVPRRITFTDSIPKGATGKPQRTLLKQRAAARHEPEGIDSQMAAVWKRMLRQYEIGADDDFFAAGGDSLSATVMLLEVEGLYGLHSGIDALQFFANPTLRTLAGMVAAANENSNGAARTNSAMLALRRSGSKPPLFCVAGANNDAGSFRHLARALGDDQPFFALRTPSGTDSLEAVAAAHVHAIRSVQRDGPLLLGGHCFGGIVAFEMARQLIASGYEVSVVAMIDSPMPGASRPARYWRGYARELFRLGVSAGELLRHLRYLADRDRRYRNPPPSACDAVSDRNEDIARRYVPARTNVRVVQFLAAADPVQSRVLEDRRLAWRHCSLAGFESRAIAARHDNILLDPQVRELAGHLREALDAPPTAKLKFV